MAKEEREVVTKKQRPSTFVGGLLNAVVSAVKFILWLLLMAVTKLGLWVPAVYALFGLGLYLFADFNPLDIGSVEGIMFLVGFCASVLCALIIAVRNVIIKPMKGVVEGYKNPFWKKKKEEKPAEKPQAKAKQPEPYPVKEPQYGYPERYFEEPMRRQIERPKIYRSELEPDSIVHEYGDRFEVFVTLPDGREVLDKIEYKRDF